MIECKECRNPEPQVTCTECDGCDVCCLCFDGIQLSEEEIDQISTNDSIGGC